LVLPLPKPPYGGFLVDKNKTATLFSVIMKVKENYFSLFPKTLNENELGGLNALIGEALRQTGTITSVFKIKENQYQGLFGYGRDRTDQVLTALVNKKMITREQKRDEAGKFTFNEVKIITDVVKD